MRLCWLFLLLWTPNIWAVHSSVLPTLKISLQESPLVRGQQLGKQAKALFPDIEQRYDWFLDQVLSQPEFDRVIRLNEKVLLSQTPKAYQQEWSGVLSVWNTSKKNKLGDGLLSQAEYYVLNILFDLGKGHSASGLLVQEEGGAPLLGENFDSKVWRLLSKFLVVTHYHDMEKAFISVGFAGLNTVYAGLNQAGVFVSASVLSGMRPHYPNSLFELKAVPIGYSLRQSLEQKSQLESVANYLTTLISSSAIGLNIVLLDTYHAALVQVSSLGISIQSLSSDSEPILTACIIEQGKQQLCHSARALVQGQYLSQELNAKQGEWLLTQVQELLQNKKNDRFELLNQETYLSLIYDTKERELWVKVIADDGRASYMNYAHVLPQDNTVTIRLSLSHYIWFLVFFLSILFFSLILIPKKRVDWGGIV